MSQLLFQALADKWESAGRPAKLLIDVPWSMLALMSWTHSDGAKKEGISEGIARFEYESRRRMDKRFPGWYDDLLFERHHCEGCGERYRMENLSMCTNCQRICCYWCSTGERAANGNRAHSCGGEFVG